MHWKKYLLMERKYKLPWKPLILNSNLPFFKNYARKWHLPIMAVNITQLLTRYEGSIWFGPEGTFFAQGQRPRATLLSKVRPTNYMLPESMSITGDYCVTWTSIYVVCSKYSKYITTTTKQFNIFIAAVITLIQPAFTLSKIFAFTLSKISVTVLFLELAKKSWISWSKGRIFSLSLHTNWKNREKKQIHVLYLCTGTIVIILWFGFFFIYTV